MTWPDMNCNVPLAMGSCGNFCSAFSDFQLITYAPTSNAEETEVEWFYEDPLAFFKDNLIYLFTTELPGKPPDDFGGAP